MNPRFVGVIGVGAMGMGVAESLLRAGYKTYVRDIVAERMTEAEKLGAIACASPAVMARDVEVIIIKILPISSRHKLAESRLSIIAS